MSQESLRNLLAQLHERLSSATSVDAEGRDMLRTVMGDIERTLGRGAPGQSPGVPAEPSDRGTAGHASRLEALAIRFEAQHPAIASLLRQLVDLLEKAGI